MSLGALPPELIFRIYDFLDPISHLDFAVTSKKIAEYSSDILAHHRRCHASLQVCSDRDLASFPGLLRSVVKDHIAAWHVRTFEVWSRSGLLTVQKAESGKAPRSKHFVFQSIVSQPQFQEFSPEELRFGDYEKGNRFGNSKQQAEAIDTTTIFDGTTVLLRPEPATNTIEPRVFFEAEMTAMAPFLRSRTYALGIPPSIFGNKNDRLISKDLGAHEALFFAMCTRIQSIKFVRFPLQSVFGEEWITEHNIDSLHEWVIHKISVNSTDRESSFLLKQNPFNHFCDAIQSISSMTIPVWPPGYQSLRTVVLNCKVGHKTKVKSIQATAAAPLFLLPNIETLYIRRLAFEEDYYSGDAPLDNNGDRVDKILPVNSSSVKHLYFDEAWVGDNVEQLRDLIASAKGLESAIFKDCYVSNFDMIVGRLPRSRASSLRTLIYCGNRNELSGYRCQIFLPEEIEDIRTLKSITLNPSDVRLGSLLSGECDSRGYDGLRDGLTGNVAAYDDFIEFFQNAIPESIETLIFTGHGFSEILNDKDIQAFDDALVRLIEEERCPQLRAVYLEEIEVAGPRPMPEGGWFRKAVECGKSRGINVLTDLGSTKRCLADLCNSVLDPKSISARRESKGRR